MDILRARPKIADADGNEVECQNILSKHNPSEGRLDRVLFVPEIPACGAKLYHAVNNDGLKTSSGKLTITKNVLKNRRWKISVDKKSGGIKSLYDIKNKIELL